MAAKVEPTPGGPAPDLVGDVLVAPEGGFADWAAAHLEVLLRELAHRRGGPVSVGLAGGRTPKPVYEALSQLPVPWERLEIFFGDERAVAPEDSESNYRMVRESLLDRVPIPAQRVHRMKAETVPLVAAAREYAAVLPDAIDLLLLGVGTDGHTASLFPGGGALRAEETVAPSRAPMPPHPRLTLTPPVLGRAGRIVVLASGSAKARPVARALTGPWDPVSCPAQLARRGTWLLDRAAASALTPPLVGSGSA